MQYSKIRSTLAGLIVAGVGFWSFSVQAQTTEQIGALTEALRLAAPHTGTQNDGLYSDWQVKPENIVSWSKFCRTPTTPAEFQADPQLARGLMTCVIGDLLKEEYAASNGNIEVAVLRSASWWMTGDSLRYTQDDTIARYTQSVLSAYLRLSP